MLFINIYIRGLRIRAANAARTRDGSAALATSPSCPMAAAFWSLCGGLSLLRRSLRRSLRRTLAEGFAEGYAQACTDL